ncbi:hypothetical protein EZ449_04460 [Pedobacter frigidisoli]|uniref:Uncharacterized protein n=1 Tax=Pedobacter frigidisoli TaxID=2530455 RepID=A0A4R0P7N6_9SPHI|nr:hypothetical protein [Pedobacter frigidisoli]TCD11522.1 hypothetical protein EZ449_04460 [Pedobacter frigidisoli]
MNEELKVLISYYKDEESLIESLIKEDVIDQDHQAIHLHSLVLNKIQRKINFLEKLTNPNAAKLEAVKNRLEYLNKLSNKNNAFNYHEEISKQIDHQLDLLNSFTTGYFNDGQEFDDAVFDLAENRIESFIFNLNKSRDLSLKFTKTGHEILVLLSNFKKLKKEYILDIDKRNILKLIGFREDKQMNALILTYDLAGFRDAIPLKQIISRVIFDVFNFQNLDNQTTLQIFK